MHCLRLWFTVDHGQAGRRLTPERFALMARQGFPAAVMDPPHPPSGAIRQRPQDTG
jgi:hypothetical protein